MTRILNQGYQPIDIPVLGWGRGQGFELVLNYPGRLHSTGLWEQIMILPLFAPICLSSHRCMSQPVSETNKNGWQISDQALQAFPNQEITYFNHSYWFFFFNAAQLSEQWSANKIRGQMPKPSRNVMGKKQKQVKGFPIIFFMFKYTDFVISVWKWNQWPIRPNAYV